MYYNSSSNNNKVDDSTIKATSTMIWFAMQSSAPMLAACLYIMENYVKIDPILPELKTIFICISILTIPLVFVLTNRFRQSEREISGNLHAGIENEKKLLQRYITYLVIGLSLCGLPAMFGLVLYIISGEILISVIFIALSFIFGFFYKPAL